MLATGVLAHQGGWDEILMVLAPVTLFVVLLKLANKRNAAEIGAAGTADVDATDEATGSDDSAMGQD